MYLWTGLYSSRTLFKDLSNANYHKLLSCAACTGERINPVTWAGFIKVSKTLDCPTLNIWIIDCIICIIVD